MATLKAPKTVKTVGYIGLGNAGFSMASNLPKNDFNVVVFDIDTDKVQKAAREWKNTTASDGSAESFKDCDMIVTMLPQGKVVREVIIGKGIEKGAQTWSVIIPSRWCEHDLINNRHDYSRHLILLTLRHPVPRP